MKTMIGLLIASILLGVATLSPAATNNEPPPPVYRVTIANPPPPIPVTNAVGSWPRYPNAPAVALEDIPGYRPPAKPYEPPPQDPPATTGSNRSAVNGDHYSYGNGAVGYPAGTYFTYGSSYNYPPGSYFSYGTGGGYGGYGYGGNYYGGYYPAPGVVVGFGVGVKHHHHHRHRR